MQTYRDHKNLYFNQAIDTQPYSYKNIAKNMDLLPMKKK